MAQYIKPTLDTKFHIDFYWWQKPEKNLRAYLEGQACPEAKTIYSEQDQNQTFDWINPETGEVFKLDIIWHLIHTHCSQEPDYINELTPLTVAIFRTFIINNNTPLTPVEIYEQLRRKTPELILKTIGGHKVYGGIRPVVMPF